VLSAAAAVILGIVLSWMALPRRNTGDGPVARVVEVSGAASLTGDGVVRGDGVLTGEVATPELRWVVDPGAPSPARGMAGGFPAGNIRLLGFRPGVRARDALEESRRPEWVVHAGVNARALLASEARYFLVSEDLEGEGSAGPRAAEVELEGPGSSSPDSSLASTPTEIAPLTWYVPSGSDASAAPRRGERAYRVYVLPGLRVPFVATDREEDQFLLWKPRSRGVGAWTLPASFEQ
jgi:hypothetical protein